MKKKFYVLLMSFVFVNCSTAQSVIGKIEDGKAVLTADKVQILKNWNENLLKESRIDAKLETVEIFELNKVYYLRAKGKEYVSTLLLEESSNHQLVALGISCTSKQCSDTNGCIPDGKTKCTTCKLGAGDCVKTVSSLTMTDPRE